MYSDVFYIGKQYAIAGQLPGMVDLNLGVDYRYSKLFSLYVELNNMANYKYQRWYNYPSQGIWFLGGLKVTI